MTKVTFSLCGLLLTCMGMISCTKSATESQVQNTPPAKPAIAITGGNYILTTYRQKTEDKSAKFDGYVFTFTATSTNTGTIEAVNGSKSVSGQWNFSPAVTYYGSSSKNAITISMGTSIPFNLLTKTWNVDSTSSSVKLELSNPEILSDEHLVFSKQ